CVGGDRALAANQNQVPCSAINKPPRCLRTKAAKRARQHMSSGSRNLPRGGMLTDLALGRRRYDQFSDVARALHQAERFAHISRSECGVRQRLQQLLLELLDQLGEDAFAMCSLDTDKLIDVHAEITEVLAERPQPDMRVADIVAFAELDEA